jgi:hypothetical protein
MYIRSLFFGAHAVWRIKDTYVVCCMLVCWYVGMLVCKYVKKTVLELGFMGFMGFMGFRHLPAQSAPTWYKRHICCMLVCWYVNMLKKTIT